MHVISQWGVSKQVAHHVRCKKIITVHDLFDPEGHTERLVNELKQCLSDYETIFVPSEFTHQQLSSHFPDVNSRIQIIPDCVDADFFKPLAVRQDGIKRLIYVGTEKPSKNLPLLFEAFARLRKSFGNNLELIKVGRPSHGQRGSLVKLANTLGVENSIRWIDWVSDYDLVRLYNLADIYVQPSICEGFGMPVVEAMACGRPVIANNSSSLPEVVGDAGLLFDNSVEGLMDSLYKVFSDLQIREDMGKRGRERVLNLFTPGRISKMMLVAYEKTLEK